MGDERTSEQVAADEHLGEAINAALEAYGFKQEGHITASYMVLVNQRGWHEDHSGCSAIYRLYQDGELAWTEILGLLRAATIETEEEFRTSERGDRG